MKKEYEIQQQSDKNLDDFSMETSKSFIHALSDLKSLRHELYSAAEYCEKSYHNGEQKKMVMEHVKDYATGALVNTIDHLGMVTYELTDLIEQQTLDISSMELKFTSLNRTYMNRRGLKQHHLLPVIPRHHKHYILPNSPNNEVHFSPQIEMDARQKLLQAKPLIYSAETMSSFHHGTQNQSTRTTMPKAPRAIVGTFQLLDDGETISSNPLSRQYHSSIRGPASNITLQSVGVTGRENLRVLTSVNNASGRNIPEAVQPSNLDSFSLASPPPKKFEWHLSPETKYSFKWTRKQLVSFQNSRAAGATVRVFQPQDGEDSDSTNSVSSQNIRNHSAKPAPNVGLPSFRVTKTDNLEEDLKSRTTHKSFDKAYRKIKQVPGHSKVALSEFLAKQKTRQLNANSLPGFSFLNRKK